MFIRFLASLTALFFIGILSACGGGGGIGSIPLQLGLPFNISNSSGNASALPTEVTIHAADVMRIETDLVAANNTASLITLTTSNTAPNRLVALSRNGTRLVAVTGALIITPGGTDNLDSRGNAYLRDVSRRVNPSSALGQAGIRGIGQRVYIASFPNHNCNGYRFQAHAGNLGGEGEARHFHVVCTGVNNTVLAEVTVHKAEAQLRQLCYEDMNGGDCDFRFDNSPPHDVFLAFPEQQYRRDDGKCETAPFYAAANCQKENAVDIGNMALFVSGLDGNGYRQFGMRHRLELDDWKLSGLVSHSKGDEFPDTWWGKVSANRLLFGEVRGFAEYEAGITSLRQKGRLFADLPIAGGRAGFKSGDFVMSFGRPMHYQGKGKNTAAMHWRFDKKTTFGLTHNGNNTDARIEWRHRF